MQFAVTLVAPPDAVFVPETVALHALQAEGVRAVGRSVLGERAVDLRIEAQDGALPRLRQIVAEAVRFFPLDVCVQPWEGRRKRLLVADMDSTIIGCECLDEIADFAGVKDKVAAITERAIRSASS